MADDEAHHLSRNSCYNAFFFLPLFSVYVYPKSHPSYNNLNVAGYTPRRIRSLGCFNLFNNVPKVKIYIW